MKLSIPIENDAVQLLFCRTAGRLIGEPKLALKVIRFSLTIVIVGHRITAYVKYILAHSNCTVKVIPLKGTEKCCKTVWQQKNTVDFVQHQQIQGAGIRQFDSLRCLVQTQSDAPCERHTAGDSRLF
jgi:hypothetical protein